MEHKTSFYENLPMLHEKRKKLTDRLTGCGHEVQRLQIELSNVELAYDSIYTELEAVEELIFEIEQAEK